MSTIRYILLDDWPGRLRQICIKFSLLILLSLKKHSVITNRAQNQHIYTSVTLKAVVIQMTNIQRALYETYR